MTNLQRWLEARHLGIGGSDAGTASGRNPFDSAYALWTKKTGLDDSVKPDNAAMEWGRRLEPSVLTKLQDEHRDATVVPGTAMPRGFEFEATCVYRDPEHAVWRSKKWPFMQATPDGYSYGFMNVPWYEGLILVEVKTSRDRWEELPPYIVAQVQHNLAVFGLKRAVVPHLALADRHYEEWWIDRDDDYIAQLVDAEATFWKSVEDNDAPPMDTSEATVAALVRMRVGDGIVADLPPEALGWDERLATVAKLRKQYDAEDKELRAKFATAIGGAAGGLLPNGVLWTFREEHRKGYTVAPRDGRVLRRRNGR